MVKLGKVKDKTNKLQKTKKEVTFNDLTKKEQKELALNCWLQKHPTKKVKPKEIEAGTKTIVKLVKDNSGIEMYKIVAITSYPKKK